MDERTLTRWYSDYGYAVHRRCLRILQSTAEADDALHDVFLKALHHGEEVRAESPLGWLYTLADRTCFERLRERGRTSSESPEDISDGNETKRDAEGRTLFSQVLASCKERVQQVAVLYYVDELTQDEVAERLGYSRKTVKEKLAQFKTVAKRLLSTSGLKRGGAA